jgi:diacylglycerol O-acyltransferase
MPFTPSSHEERAMSQGPGHLSAADAAWLHMDRPTNLMVINTVLLFDEQLDWERLAEVLSTRLVAPHPRFRQRVTEGRLSRGPRWEEDRDFDLSRHLHHRGLAAPGGEAALKELAGDLASAPLDRGKPLWDMYFIDGPGEGCAVIVRMHHCIADGVALAQVMLSLTDTAPGPEIRSPRPARAPARTVVPALLRAPVAAAGAGAAALVKPATGALATGGRVARALARESMHTLSHPGRALELAGSAAADARALGKLLLTPDDDGGAFKGELGTARTVAWGAPLSLQSVKAIAHAQHATVNDVLLAAVSGALRGYLLEHGREPQEMRTTVPYNLRPPPAADATGAGAERESELGNRFGLVFLTLPVDRAARRERLGELKRRMDAIKHSPEGPVSYALLEVIGLTPPEVESRLVDVFTAKATAVMTNVPGPGETVYLAGSPLRTVLVWAPTAGSVGMSVSIFSYDGRITVGLLVHTALVADPQAILGRLGREVAALGRLAPSTNGRPA